MKNATDELVDRFAAAMKEKLRKTNEKFGDAWMREDWEEDCLYFLAQHLDKGDPVDCANYLAFMWHHGWTTRLV